MTLTSRGFCWGDLRDLHALVSENWRRYGPHVSLHIGDLYWGLRPQPNSDPERDIRVWRDAEGRLAGFCWFDHSGDGNLVLRQDADASLHTSMLDWIEEDARGRGLAACSAASFENDAGQIGQLEARGYKQSESSDPHLLVDLITEPQAPESPAGYTVRSISGDDEIEKRAAVHREAWSTWGPSSLTAEVYETLVRSPGYRRELDLVAVDDQGEFASCTNVWYDEDIRVGEFEPVGCHPAHRRKGVTRALMFEGLRRLRNLGAERAIVYTSSNNPGAQALYESCGFSVIGYDRYYTKQLS